eukprot:jgi/Botrbrau1/14122/Bobra.182_3s0065.1
MASRGKIMLRASIACTSEKLRDLYWKQLLFRTNFLAPKPSSAELQAAGGTSPLYHCNHDKAGKKSIDLIKCEVYLIHNDICHRLLARAGGRDARHTILQLLERRFLSATRDVPRTEALKKGAVGASSVPPCMASHDSPLVCLLDGPRDENKVKGLHCTYF